MHALALFQKDVKVYQPSVVEAGEADSNSTCHSDSN